MGKWFVLVVKINEINSVDYHVIVSMDFVLISNKLNLIGPTNIPAVAMNYCQ